MTESICCYLECEALAEWRIRHGDELDDYTESCTDHVGALLTDAPVHRVYPITEPLLKGARRHEKAEYRRILSSQN